MATCACPAHYEQSRARVQPRVLCLMRHFCMSRRKSPGQQKHHEFLTKVLHKFSWKFTSCELCEVFSALSPLFLLLLFLFSFFLPLMPPSLPLLLFEIYDTINFVKHLKLQSSRKPPKEFCLASPLSLPRPAPIPVEGEANAGRAFCPTFLFLCLISH